jgi:hypothetical protein
LKFTGFEGTGNFLKNQSFFRANLNTSLNKNVGISLFSKDFIRIYFRKLIIFLNDVHRTVKGVLMVKRIERPTFISMFRGSNPGSIIGIFLQHFIISATLAPSGPSIDESTFHNDQLKITDLLNFKAFIMRCLHMSVNEFV